MNNTGLNFVLGYYTLFKLVCIIVRNRLQHALNYLPYKHITRAVSVGTAPVAT